MSDKVKKQEIYKAHYLISCRIDNWVRLLRENKFKISKDKVPQLLYMLGTSILLTPFTLLESAIYAAPIRRHKMKKDPVFIIGHWRSGTTYLQNLLSKDKQFGWCDPVSTTTFCNSYLLKPLVAKVQRNVLKDARPMDNMEYKLDLPMEDVFALNLISTHSIIHLLAFPQNFRHYLKESFTDEQIIDNVHAVLASVYQNIPVKNILSNFFRHVKVKKFLSLHIYGQKVIILFIYSDS